MNFKEQLQRKREAATLAQDKPVSEMTEAELDQKLQQAREELRLIKERELAATREAAADAGSAGGLQAFLASRRRARKAPWK
jgi:DNA invertase Pin-like site-specific DNA recombinase